MCQETLVQGQLALPWRDCGQVEDKITEAMISVWCMWQGLNPVLGVRPKLLEGREMFPSCPKLMFSQNLEVWGTRNGETSLAREISDQSQMISTRQKKLVNLRGEQHAPEGGTLLCGP